MGIEVNKEDIMKHIQTPLWFFDLENFKLIWTMVKQVARKQNQNPIIAGRESVTIKVIKQKWNQKLELLFKTKYDEDWDRITSETMDRLKVEAFREIGIYVTTEQMYAYFGTSVKEGVMESPHELWKMAMSHLRDCVYDEDKGFNEQMSLDKITPWKTKESRKIILPPIDEEIGIETEETWIPNLMFESDRRDVGSTIQEQLQHMNKKSKQQIENEYKKLIRHGPLEETPELPGFTKKQNKTARYVDPRNTLTYQRSWKQTGHLVDIDIERTTKNSMEIRRKPQPIQYHLLRKAAKPENIYFRFLAVAIRFLLTFVGREKWPGKTKIPYHKLEKQAKELKGSENETTKHGLIYAELINIVVKLKKAEVQPSDKVKQLKTEYAGFLEDIYALLQKPVWTHQQKNEINYQIIQARRELESITDIHERQIKKLKTNMYQIINEELIPVRFRYYVGEVQYLDRGFYRNTDKLFTLVNDIIDLPEWDEQDCEQVQEHFKELLQAGLYPNAPENDKSRFYENNSMVLKYMETLCQQYNLKVRIPTDALIRQLKAKKGWGFTEISKLYLRLKETNRHGKDRNNYLTGVEADELEKLTDQVGTRFTGLKTENYLLLPGQNVPPWEQEMNEDRRFRETEDSILTSDLIARIVKTPMNQWEKRDLSTLRYRMERYNTNKEGSKKDMKMIQSIFLQATRTCKSLITNMGSVDVKQEDKYGNISRNMTHILGVYQNPGDEKNHHFMYHLQPQDIKYKRIQTDTENFDLLHVASNDQWLGNTFLKKQTGPTLSGMKYTRWEQVMPRCHVVEETSRQYVEGIQYITQNIPVVGKDSGEGVIRVSVPIQEKQIPSAKEAQTQTEGEEESLDVVTKHAQIKGPLDDIIVSSPQIISIKIKPGEDNEEIVQLHLVPDIRNNLSQMLEQLEQKGTKSEPRQTAKTKEEDIDQNLQKIFVSLVEKNLKKIVEPEYETYSSDSFPVPKQIWRRRVNKDLRVRLALFPVKQEEEFNKVLLDSLKEMRIEITNTARWQQIKIPTRKEFFRPGYFNHVWEQIANNSKIQISPDVWKTHPEDVDLFLIWEQEFKESDEKDLNTRINKTLETVGIYLNPRYYALPSLNPDELPNIIWKLAINYIDQCLFNPEFGFNDTNEANKKVSTQLLKLGDLTQFHELYYKEFDSDEEYRNEEGYPMVFDVVGRRIGFHYQEPPEDETNNSTGSDDPPSFIMGITQYQGEESQIARDTEPLIWTKIVQRPEQSLIQIQSKDRFLMEISAPRDMTEGNTISEVYMAKSTKSKWNQIILANQTGVVGTIRVCDTTIKQEKDNEDIIPEWMVIREKDQPSGEEQKDPSEGCANRILTDPQQESGEQINLDS